MDKYICDEITVFGMSCNANTVRRALPPYHPTKAHPSAYGTAAFEISKEISQSCLFQSSYKRKAEQIPC